MATVRQRRSSKKTPYQKVRQRPKVVKNILPLTSLVSTHWNSKDTLQRNYQTVGLLNKVNEDLNSRETLNKIKDWNYKRWSMVKEGQKPAEFDSEDEMFNELEEIFKGDGSGSNNKVVKELVEKAQKDAASWVPKEKKLSSEDEAYIKKLIAKYGDDFDRMLMDIKLNYWQHSVSKLKKMASMI